MNSRQKGKVGEREFASLLREHGFDARRGQQFSGGADWLPKPASILVPKITRPLRGSRCSDVRRLS